MSSKNLSGNVIHLLRREYYIAMTTPKHNQSLRSLIYPRVVLLSHKDAQDLALVVQLLKSLLQILHLPYILISSHLRDLLAGPAG